MRFLNGSHKLGPMGRVIHRTDGVDFLDLYPWMFDEFELSEPMHLKPGDATAHNLLTVHAAPENQTSDPRWSYLTSMFPADGSTFAGCSGPNAGAVRVTGGRPSSPTRAWSWIVAASSARS